MERKRCVHCGRTFKRRTYPSRVQQAAEFEGRKYCSRACFYDALSERTERKRNKADNAIRNWKRA